MLASRTARQVEDWHARGLIDADTSRALLADIGAGGGGRSFASIAIWLGITCLAFGSMTFVAANWDAMPRLLRMGLLLAGMLASYVMAGALHRQGKPGGAEAFVLLGCGVFGAAVMLTGQMYHLTGPPSGAVLLWTIGTFVAALATGASTGALGLATILATLWTAMWMTTGGGDPFHLWFLPIWAALSGAAWWVRSRTVAHLCALAAMVWIAISVGIVMERDASLAAGAIAIMAGFAAISLAIFSERSLRALRGFEREAAFYLLVFIFGMLAFLFIAAEIGMPARMTRIAALAALPLALLALLPAWKAEERFDHILAALWVCATALTIHAFSRGMPYAIEGFALAVSVWTIRMGGRQGWRAISGLGYAAFAVTIIVIYTSATHGLLGTSLFYLGAGALLLIGALVVPKLVAVRETTR